MRKICILIGIAFATLAHAQEVSVPDSAILQDTIVEALPFPAIISDMTNVKIEQDSLITILMQEKIAGVERGQKTKAGFRVQIYSSSRQQTSKTEAMQMEKMVADRIDVPVYVTYTPPFWKVRLGDFQTQEEATAYKEHLKELFPELQAYTYVVRDNINIAK